MNMRQHRRLVLARMFHDVRRGICGIGQSTWMGFQNPALVKFADGISSDTVSLRDMLWRISENGVAQEEVEESKVEYVCLKVKDDSVVDTFDTREEALALVLKHARQKKAKLYVMNSAAGIVEVFTEEEMT